MDSQEQEVQEEIKEPQEEDNPEATQKGKKTAGASSMTSSAPQLKPGLTARPQGADSEIRNS